MSFSTLFGIILLFLGANATDAPEASDTRYDGFLNGLYGLGRRLTAATADVEVDWDWWFTNSADWATGHPTTMRVGSTLSMNWDSTRAPGVVFDEDEPTRVHNVYQLPNKEAFDSCDFTNAVFLGDSSPVVVTVAAGMQYFSCKSHCTFGQSIAVNGVEPAPASASPTESPTWERTPTPSRSPTESPTSEPTPSPTDVRILGQGETNPGQGKSSPGSLAFWASSWEGIVFVTSGGIGIIAILALCVVCRKARKHRRDPSDPEHGSTKTCRGSRVNWDDASMSDDLESARKTHSIVGRKKTPKGGEFVQIVTGTKLLSSVKKHPRKIPQVDVEPMTLSDAAVQLCSEVESSSETTEWLPVSAVEIKPQPRREGMRVTGESRDSTPESQKSGQRRQTTRLSVKNRWIQSALRSTVGSILTPRLPHVWGGR